MNIIFFLSKGFPEPEHIRSYTDASKLIEYVCIYACSKVVMSRSRNHGPVRGGHLITHRP